MGCDTWMSSWRVILENAFQSRQRTVVGLPRRGLSVPANVTVTRCPVPSVLWVGKRKPESVLTPALAGGQENPIGTSLR